MMRGRNRLAAGLSILLLTTAAVTAAVAQPKPHAKPKPKPQTGGDPDNPYGTEPVAASPGAATGDGGLGPVPPPPHVELGDGGVKPSPLNPAASEMPQAPGVLPAASASASVDYDRLLADIASLRARVSAVGDNLFVSRIAIGVRTDGDHGKVARVVVSLDDGVVYTAPPNYHPEDTATIYEHAVAPGRHAVTIDVDRRDDHDDSFRTSQRSRFIVDVPKDQRLDVALRVEDDSNMGSSFPADRSGKYDLRVRMKASAGPAPAKK
jgi:hypothetical protein